MGAHLQKGRAGALCEDEAPASGQGFQSCGRRQKYTNTTYPTPAAAPVKMIAAVANEKSWLAYRLDVSQAFSQAPRKEEMLPPGCGELSGKVVRLLKCQCGLKQAGREWYILLVNWLVD